jgi:hypothetical protein
MRTPWIQILAWATIAVWLLTLLQQLAFLGHALQPQFIYDPRIGVFARHYALSSSLYVITFTLAGCGLAVCVLRSRAPWASVLLFVLSGIALWHFYVAGLSMHFRPPSGDGSFRGALASYQRLLSARLWFQPIWFDLPRAAFFAASILLWPIIYFRTQRAYTPFT